MTPEEIEAEQRLGGPISPSMLRQRPARRQRFDTRLFLMAAAGLALSDGDVLDIPSPAPRRSAQSAAANPGQWKPGPEHLPTAETRQMRRERERRERKARERGNQ